jgi:Tfp pilus assembly protein PilN
VRPVNLIPAEDRRGDSAPLRAGSTSYAIVGVLVLALIGVYLVVSAGNKISESENELAALETRKAQAEAAAAELADYGQFAQLEQTRSQTVSSLAQTRFDWDRVLNELALVIPRRVTLEGVTGAVGGDVSVSGGGADTGDAASIAGPSLLITGCAKGQEGVARFLAAVRDIDGVTRVGMQSSTLGEKTPSDGGDSGQVTTDSATATGPTTDCQARPSVAKFQASVAFDAVPVPAAAAPDAATPAAATTPGTTPAPTATDGGVPGAQAQEAEAAASANQQVSEGQAAAGAVGADAQ